jgi:hypothetical protein
MLPFETARSNFYDAAKHGLDAEITWFDGKQHPVTDVLEALMPMAREGLQAAGVTPGLIDRYLDVVETRLASRQNGAAWQLSHFRKYGDLFSLTAEYAEHQRTGIPVHEWPV